MKLDMGRDWVRKFDPIGNSPHLGLIILSGDSLAKASRTFCNLHCIGNKTPDGSSSQIKLGVPQLARENA